MTLSSRFYVPKAGYSPSKWKRCRLISYRQLNNVIYILQQTFKKKSSLIPIKFILSFLNYTLRTCTGKVKVLLNLIVVPSTTIGCEVTTFFGESGNFLC